jgi:DNA-binding transcriptional MerR regulator
VSEQETFRAPQACQIAGVTYRQLDYWARTDFIRPSVDSGKGSGSQRRYSYDDVLLLAAARAMLDGGMDLASIRRSVDVFRRHPELALSGEKVKVRSVGPLAITLDLGEVRGAVDRAIAATERRSA